MAEITPETCWRFGSDVMRPNGFYRRHLAQVRELGLPVIGHGVNLSVGSGDAGDEPRFARWLEWLARTHDDFHFQWYSDHFGQTIAQGELIALPMPVPLTGPRMDAIRRRLDRLAGVVPIVALETTAMPFWLGDPADEPAAITCATAGHHILLDLHNLYVMSLQGGLSPLTFLHGLPLDRVIEIHVSGGGWSEPEWLPSGVRWPLDSHDSGVPEPVWQLLADVCPRCPALRAVVLERRDGTVEAADVPLIDGELRRLRAILEGPQDPVSAWTEDPGGRVLPDESSFTDATLAEALRQGGAGPSGIEPDLWHLASIQVARLRWERLMNGSGALWDWFDREPEAFVGLFRRYHIETPMHALFPMAEVADFRKFGRRHGIELPL